MSAYGLRHQDLRCGDAGYTRRRQRLRLLRRNVVRIYSAADGAGNLAQSPLYSDGSADFTDQLSGGADDSRDRARIHPGEGLKEENGEKADEQK